MALTFTFGFFWQNEIKKGAGARANRAVDGLNKAIEVEAEGVKGVNQDNTVLSGAMNVTNREWQPCFSTVTPRQLD